MLRVGTQSTNFFCCQSWFFEKEKNQVYGMFNIFIIEEIIKKHGPRRNFLLFQSFPAKKTRLFSVIHGLEKQWSFLWGSCPCLSAGLVQGSLISALYLINSWWPPGLRCHWIQTLPCPSRAATCLSVAHSRKVNHSTLRPCLSVCLAP